MAKSHKVRRPGPRVAPPKRPQPERPPRRSRVPDDSVVLDDLPELVPIITTELDTIQIYSDDLLDQLIADVPAAKPPALDRHQSRHVPS